ncbi:hypothetical protein [Halorhabdus salina]|uniref:hypothetical protein n=1 Tax=Halorhabdus salina TaxID=2750670 RepID=UPI0015EFC530|nr:hypothetical protein [Halorhabdus salina]
MLDTKRVGVIALFTLAIALFGGGYAMVLESGVEYLPGVGLTIAGSFVLGLSWVVEFRRRSGQVSRRRTLALVASFLGVGLGSVAITPFVGSGDVANLAFLVVFIPAIVYWIHKRETGTKVTRTDERMRLLTYKSAFWMLAIIVLVSGGLLWAELLLSYTVSAKTILTLNIGIGLFGWYGTYLYVQSHN